MRAVLIAPMDQRHRFRAAAQLLGPVERGIAAPDDDDALVAELLGIRHAVEDSKPIPRFRAGLRETPRREGANPRGDYDRPRWETVGLGNQDEMILVPLEGRDVLVQVRLERKLRRLLDERVDQILRQDLRESPGIEDVLLGVERGELPAQLRQGVDDPRRRTAHSRIKGGEQSGGTAANDGDVSYLVGHL